jgi:hypothetical protein
MRYTSRLAVLAAAAIGGAGGAGLCQAEQFLTPTDFIIGIDGIPKSASAYSANEGIIAAFDNDTSTKYLNTGGRGTGVIFTPSAASILQSFQLYSGNDANGRDPASYVLMGTNAPIVSADNSNGLGEPWTLLSQGALTPPDTGGPLNDGRQAPYPVVNLTNSTAYNSYKIYFPTLRTATSTLMQISETRFFDAPNAGGNQILPGAFDNDKIRAIDNPASSSASPAGEEVTKSIDGTSSTKYLNTAREGTGLIVTPRRGTSIIKSFTLTTANDFPSRDPASYHIYGTNDAIQSAADSDGNGGENWTLIGTGALSLQPSRLTSMGSIDLSSNTTSYASYKIIFDDNVGPDDVANSIQFSEITFDGVLTAVPTWAVNNSGDWNKPLNWIGAVPNGADATAQFLSVINAPRTVFTDVPVTLGNLQFSNAATYNLNGAGALTMQVTSGSATINVAAGSQKINLPLTIASNTNVTVAAGANLTMGNPVTIAAGKTLTKSGNLTIAAPLSIGAAGAMVLNSGPTSIFGAPTLAAGAKIDVKNTTLTVDYRGLTDPATTIKNQLVQGYNGGNWNGANGITTSAAIAGQTGVGWVDNTASQSIKVKYTYLGDANVDGQVDVTDLGSLATNWQTSSAWAGGDFNYDGFVDVTDLGALATNWQRGVGSPLGRGSFEEALASVGLGAASVPEPASIATIGILFGLCGASKRRRGAR